ncbi:MAG: hypothetical protein KDA61_10010, partial [Planctomycetales bacterium]|nr:hypothetical protein [Planctomycetales bacterium]
MMDHNQRFSLDIPLVVAKIVAGEATDAEQAALFALVESDDAARREYCEAMAMASELSWTRMLIQGPDASYGDQIAITSPAESAQPLDGPKVRSPRSTSSWTRTLLAVAAIGLLTAGFTLGRYGRVPLIRGGAAAQNEAEGKSVADNVDAPIGKWEGIVNCSWLGNGRVESHVEDSVHSGEAFSLLQGTARLELANNYSIQLEGPAAFVVASPSSVVLQYGALVAVPTDATPLEVAIPSGRVKGDGAEFGVQVIGEHAELHCFSGEVVVILNPLGPPEADEELFGPGAPGEYVITAGKAVKLSVQEGSLVVTSSFQAERDRFAGMLPATGPLRIPPEYVAAVLRSKPLGYWRFDRRMGNRVLNEVEGGDELLAGGSIAYLDSHGNTSTSLLK